MLHFTFDGLNTPRSQLGAIDKRARRRRTVQRSVVRNKARSKRCPPAPASRGKLCSCHPVFCSASSPNTTSSHLRTRVRCIGKSWGSRRRIQIPSGMGGGVALEDCISERLAFRHHLPSPGQRPKFCVGSPSALPSPVSSPSTPGRALGA